MRTRGAEVKGLEVLSSRRSSDTQNRFMDIAVTAQKEKTGHNRLTDTNSFYSLYV